MLCSVVGAGGKEIKTFERHLLWRNLQSSVFGDRGSDRQVNRQVIVTAQVDEVQERMEYLRGKLSQDCRDSHT